MSENVIYSINGPVVKVKNAKDFSMLEMVCWSCKINGGSYFYF